MDTGPDRGLDREGYFAAPLTPPQHRAFGDPSARPATPPAAAPPIGRFAKTEVSFGLSGRVVLTVLLLIPLAWFCYLATHYFIGIGGIVVYGGVVVPWALRDLWRHPSRR